MTNVPLIDPCNWYSVSEAAKILGVHRSTIHAYLRNEDKPLPAKSTPNGYKYQIKGADLLDYVLSGRPKIGRPRVNMMKQSVK